MQDHKCCLELFMISHNRLGMSDMRYIYFNCYQLFTNSINVLCLNCLRTFFKSESLTLKFLFLHLFIVDNHKNRENRFWIGIWLECFSLIAFFTLNHINVVSDKDGENMSCDESKKMILIFFKAIVASALNIWIYI